ncbi:hypothetical protein N7495_007416 [Penicillium taxi]|uniref:uncharacterized protein n=1 Tax=Penicillium taxi TaxID=168475 RepID=UPI0025452A28|nr:uncharacterized protein N7495_007416 [Penicillium taxi]KAJ5887375.1 hypothetical protein N7495_007416 [Penicillium taxi]
MQFQTRRTQETALSNTQETAFDRSTQRQPFAFEFIQPPRGDRGRGRGHGRHGPGPRPLGRTGRQGGQDRTRGRGGAVAIRDLMVLRSSQHGQDSVWSGEW